MKRVPHHWGRFTYFDPRVVLPKLQSVRMLVSQSDLPDNIKNLRTRRLQPQREAWDTAILCYLISESLNLDIRFARVEESDFDSVFTWPARGQQCFAPVQMKELVPAYTNSKATLSEIVTSLNKYADSKDLIVGIKLNREFQLRFDEIDVSHLPVAQVWLFGATSPDQSRWSLFECRNKQWIRYDHSIPGA